MPDNTRVKLVRDIVQEQHISPTKWNTPPRDENDSPYCHECKGCGEVGCDGIQTFLNKHVRGKTNCTYEESYIEDIVELYKHEEVTPPNKQPEAWEDCIKDSSIQVEDTLTFPNQDWQTLISNLTPRIQKLLTARDTYWKERVRKEVEESLTVVKLRIVYDRRQNTPAEETVQDIYDSIELKLTPITNEDNLK